MQLGQDEAGDLTVTHEGSLGGHAKMVNCVRFSPSGNPPSNSPKHITVKVFSGHHTLHWCKADHYNEMRPQEGS